MRVNTDGARSSTCQFHPHVLRRVTTLAQTSIKSLQYVEMEPSVTIADVVMTHWGFTVHALPSPDFVHRVWPDGCVSLAMQFAKGECHASVVVGARTVASQVPVRAGEQYWGIRFRPEAGAACCDRAAALLRDARLPAVALFSERIHALTFALRTVTEPEAAAAIMDAWLLEQRSRFRDVDALVRAAVQHIVRTGGTCSITDVAGGLGVSMRHLQRRFRSATGLTPKEYANVRRARRALARVAMGAHSRAPGGWARMAAELGYADQAHLSRECARILSVTPNVLSERLASIAHHHLVD